MTTVLTDDGAFYTILPRLLRLPGRLTGNQLTFPLPLTFTVHYRTGLDSSSGYAHHYGWVRYGSAVERHAPHPTAAPLPHAAPPDIPHPGTRHALLR